MSLYQYLLEVKKYSEHEAEETVLRYEAGMEVPDSVLADIREYALADIRKMKEELSRKGKK